MKKSVVVVFIFFSCVLSFYPQTKNQDIVTSDIDNFWMAYDKIVATKDKAEQLEYLNKLFIEKGSDGLKKIMQARRYTPQEYVDAINNYPQFWNSIRANTYKSKQLSSELQAGIEQLRLIYPNLKPAKIYFTIGVFRTGGTTLGDSVLIGSEIMMADENSVTTEFPKSFDNLRNYFKTNPTKTIAFSNVHEYIHTQQKTTIGNNLLAQCVLEGVAEFLTVKATNAPSTAPAISYGKENFEKVRAKFTRQMYNRFTGFWLYSDVENEFNIRDIGYYVGYAISEKYYEKTKDKTRTVREMIELDYNNETELKKFVEKSGYFTKSLNTLKRQFEKSQPQVIGIKQFKNGSKTVDPGLAQITIEFSTKMDQFWDVDAGPLGGNNTPQFVKFVGFSEDRKSATFEIKLKPDTHYQFIANGYFRSLNGISLRPYLIDFQTQIKK